MKNEPLPPNAITEWMPIRAKAEATLQFRDEDHLAERPNFASSKIFRRVPLSHSAQTNYEWGIEEILRLYKKGWVCTLLVHGARFCIVREHA